MKQVGPGQPAADSLNAAHLWLQQTHLLGLKPLAVYAKWLQQPFGCSTPSGVAKSLFSLQCTCDKQRLPREDVYIQREQQIGGGRGKAMY